MKQTYVWTVSTHTLRGQSEHKTAPVTPTRSPPRRIPRRSRRRHVEPRNPEPWIGVGHPRPTRQNRNEEPFNSSRAGGASTSLSAEPPPHSRRPGHRPRTSVRGRYHALYAHVNLANTRLPRKHAESEPIRRCTDQSKAKSVDIVHTLLSSLRLPNAAV